MSPMKNLRSFALMLACGVAGLAFAPAADARDNIEFYRYMGVRLKLYAEAREALDKEIKSAQGADKSRAKQAKAEVMKDQADWEFSQGGEESDRLALYEQALVEFELEDKVEDQDPAAVAAKGLMMLELALSLRRTNPDKSREFVCGSAEMGDEKGSPGSARFILYTMYQYLEGIRFVDVPRFTKHYASFSRCMYQHCRSFYVEGMSYDSGSTERLHCFGLSKAALDNFQFALDDVTEELVLSYRLKGDIELASGQPDSASKAVGEYEALIGFVSGSVPNAYTGRLALEHGYLPAVEILTTDLDFDPKNLERAIKHYADAYATYGQIADLAYFFKRLQLFRISAQIKLGNPDLIRGAIDQLFVLSKDSDITFRRNALGVLADIATREGIELELRFKCANAVYAETENNPTSVNLKVAMAYQSVLASCSDVRTFESYGPACFERIGAIYYAMWRFMDAALIYREGVYRTLYFMSRYEETTVVPDHMAGKCGLIKEGKDLAEFPKKMAEEYERMARFLNKDDIGDPNNAELAKLLTHAQTLKARVQGESALIDLAYQNARKRFNEASDRKASFAQAAVLYVSLPASYRLFPQALYTGAQCYNRLSQDRAATRISRRGDKAEQESEEWFAAQRARHATDLEGLPAGMITGVDSHWDAIMDAQTQDQLANWHKALYYYKKYFLIEAKLAWAEVQPKLATVENADLVDAMAAIASIRNEAWNKENPTGRGEPYQDMKRMAYAAYDLAWLLRNPPVGESRAEDRALAIRILRPFWNMFGIHLAGNLNYEEGALRSAFYGLVESRDADNCEALYMAYRQLRDARVTALEKLKARPKPTDAEAAKLLADEIKDLEDRIPKMNQEVDRMVAYVYDLVLKALQPKANAMTKVSSGLVSRSNQLKKNTFERISESQYPEDAKKLAEAKGVFEKQKVMARHFWAVWLEGMLFEGERNDDVRAELPDVLPLIRKKWDEMSATYPERWGKAVRAELTDRLKNKNYDSIRDAVNKAIAGADDTGLMDRIEVLKNDTKDPKLQQLMIELVQFIRVNTDALMFFEGTVFIYEFGNFLEKVAEDVDERARAPITRILMYYEEWRNAQGKSAGEGVKEDVVLNLGKQYFRIRDWKNTVKYYEYYISNFCTDKDAQGKPKVTRMVGSLPYYAGERLFGSEVQIGVDARTKTAGRKENDTEYAVRYQLGKAYFELFRESGNKDHLAMAALNLRRCYAFNMIRDANEITNKQFTLTFQKSLEDFYLFVGQTLADVYLAMFEVGDIKVDWPKYVDQYAADLQPVKGADGKVQLQWTPGDKAAYLWAAKDVHQRIWVSFRKLTNYAYRTEFRHNFVAWLKLNVLWFETYGKDEKGIPELKGGTFKEILGTAASQARSESANVSVVLTDDTKAHLEVIKEQSVKLDALAKKLGVDAK